MTTSEQMRAALRGDWQILESSPIAQLASLPVAGPAGADARIAVGSDGARHLLVRTSLPSRPWTQAETPLKDSVHALTFAGTRNGYLDVRCSSRSLFDVFDELILDVLESAPDDKDAGAAIDAALTKWRALFRAVSAGSFGKEQRYGLFAELTVLEACVETAGAAALAMWTGPAGRPHDFELPHDCLEVKALGATANSVTIHGLRQLEVDRQHLSLLVYILEESSNGRTIRELVEAIESKVGEGALAAPLQEVGFTITAPDERLSVMDSFSVEIGQHTPALTSASVSSAALAGISRVEYDIPLANLTKHSDPTSPTSAVIARAFRS